MLGGITSRQRCPVCGSKYREDARKGCLACPAHPEQRATGAFRLTFGRGVNKQFSTYEAAARFRTGLQFETDQDKFDKRDYQAGKPLGFANLYADFLDKKTGSRKHTNNLRAYGRRMASAWGNRNVKEIGYAEIEDFLLAQDVSQTTRAKMRSALHDFFRFLQRRRILAHHQIPDMPEVRFENAMRAVVPPHVQAEILAEVRRLSYEQNPRVWIGIKWLSTYIAMRPGDIPRIREQDVSREAGTLYLRCPKDKRPKLVPLAAEDVDLVRELPAGMPDLPFFRHAAGISGVAAGAPFGDKYLWKWWRKACENIGIHGVDLYGGTRHSTACALGEVCSPEEIRHATMHGTNKAFERYYTMSQDRRRSIYEQALRQRDRSRPAPDKKCAEAVGGASCKILEFKDKDG